MIFILLLKIKGVSRMTDEEIAEEYANNCCGLIKELHWQDVKWAVLYGLAEGRKEGYEQGKNNERESQCGKKNYEKDIARLEKENNSFKQILINLVTAFNNYECAGPEQEQENTWETLRDLMHEELLKIQKE